MPSPTAARSERDAAASVLQTETAAKIVNWIIQNDLPVGYHLKEIELGNRFSLSRSPVRGALQVLQEHGVVEKKPSCGFYVAVSGSKLAERGPELPAVDSEDLYRRIATDWIKGRFGERVSTAEFLRVYDHAHDVRRVLQRLSGDGVIERTDGNGWRLGPNLASERAYHDSYTFRRILEPQAILLDTFRLVVPLAQHSRRRHEEIAAGGPASTIPGMIDADIEFHQMIAASCGNEFLAQTIAKHTSLRRLTELLTEPDGDRLRTSTAEHLEILDAIEGGDRPAAARLMTRHLTLSEDYTPEFDKVGSRRGQAVE